MQSRGVTWCFDLVFGSHLIGPGVMSGTVHLSIVLPIYLHPHLSVLSINELTIHQLVSTCLMLLLCANVILDMMVETD